MINMTIENSRRVDFEEIKEIMPQSKLVKQFENLQKQNAILKKCAEFYADPNSWWWVHGDSNKTCEHIFPSDIQFETDKNGCGGKVALEALKEVGEVELRKE